jgi:hypothetical protein
MSGDGQTRVVWKFPIPNTGSICVVVTMPKGARVLSVATQVETPTLWALVDPGALKVERRLMVLMTGQNTVAEVPDTGQRLDEAAFIGTTLLMGGSLVLHVFDFGEAPLSASQETT